MNTTKKTIIPLITITAFALYIITDSIEIAQSAISSFQMIVTYICMAAIPFAVMGLYILDDKEGGALYLTGAVFISLSFIYFSGTASYALVEHINDYADVVKNLGFMYLLHGMILIIGGILFSVALLRAKIAHPIIAYGILAGSVVSLITGLFQLSEQFYIVGNYVRNVSFVFLGIWKLGHK